MKNLRPCYYVRRRFQLLWECQNWSILFFTLGRRLRYTPITPIFILAEESLYSPLSPWLLSYQLARLSTRDGPMVNHTLHLSNALSVAFSEEDPRSFTNVLRLLHEPETNLCSLTSPQRVLVNRNVIISSLVTGYPVALGAYSLLQKLEGELTQAYPKISGIVWEDKR